jgi:hypothetical protein
MGDPLQHARSSADTFGGLPSDYLEIHQILDSSKLFLADWRHRSVLHNTFGVHLMENWIIGPTFLRASDGVEVCTRTVVTQHIMEDLNMVPTLGEFLREMPLRRWMMRATAAEVARMKTQSFADEAQDPGITVHAAGVPETRVTASVVWQQGLPTTPGSYLIDHQSACYGIPIAHFNGVYWNSRGSSVAPSGWAPTWWAAIPLDPVLDEAPEMQESDTRMPAGMHAVT